MIYKNFIIRTLSALTSKRLILPFYHTISNKKLIHIKHLYNIRSEKEFKKDLDFFLSNYKPIDLYELIDIVNGNKKIKKNMFFLSFDDGLSEVYEVIAPILKEKGVPTTIFLNSGFIDNKDLFFRYKASILIEKIQNLKSADKQLAEVEKILKNKHWFNKNICHSILKIGYEQKYILEKIATIVQVDFKEYLKQYKPYLSTEQIQKLIDDGFTIGSHSIVHPEYQYLELSEQIRQTKESIDFITNNFNINYKAFAFPFTDYGVKKEFFEVIYNEHNPIIDISFGTAGIKNDVFVRNLQRIPVEEYNSNSKNIIIKEYINYILKLIFYKTKIRRK
ncbi:MAG: polysaccharide deacetylase family protein [Bacteroidales bacterium]|nr:polysaccharide deacetylase family protein [Bacteroidales bacterium]